MSDLQVLVNSPIGAVFFVCGAISVLVLLAIFMLKKGNDLHSVLGYLFFFGLCFANYSATISYYEGYLPLAAISLTIPASTFSLVLGLAAIIPSSKSLLRIRIHIVSSCIAATSVCLGTMINWYHFNVVPLDIFRWDDFSYLATLSVPLLIVGGILGFYFFLQSADYYKALSMKRDQAILGVDSQEIVSSHGVRTNDTMVVKSHEARDELQAQFQ